MTVDKVEEEAVLPNPAELKLEPASKWPNPIPEEWQAGRAANAEKWYQEVRDKTQRVYFETQARAAKAKADAEELAKQQTLQQAAIEGFDALQSTTRSKLGDSLRATVTAITHGPAVVRSPHVVRVPHFTALRPVVVLSAPITAGGSTSGPGFAEQLFVRGLVSTLLRYATGAEARADGEQLYRSSHFSALLRPGCGAGDIVWWEPAQPAWAKAGGAAMARLEALQSCAVAVVVLSAAYATSPVWASERDALTARLFAQDVEHPFHLVVIRYSHDPRTPPPRFTVPKVPPGHPCAGAGLLLTELTLPQPHTFSAPLRDGTSAGEAGATGAGPTPWVQSQVQSAFEGLRSVLATAHVVLPQPHRMSQLFWHPAPAVDAAADAGALTAPGAYLRAHTLLDVTMGAVSAGALPATPYEPGASWAAAMSLPYPAAAATRAPLHAWSMHDVQVWVDAMGKATASAASKALLGGCIDGALLAALAAHEAGQADAAVREILGVADASARRALLAELTKLAAAARPSPRAKGAIPAHSEVSPLLLTLSDEQLSEVFSDVVRYYDSDLSGDLDERELGALLGGAGLILSSKEVRDVCVEYDVDEDGVLDGAEALQVVWEVWRLVVSARDAAAWNPPALPGVTQGGPASAATSRAVSRVPSMLGSTALSGPGSHAGGHKPAASLVTAAAVRMLASSPSMTSSMAGMRPGKQRVSLLVDNEPVHTTQSPWAGAQEAGKGAGGMRSAAGSVWGGDGGDAISGWGEQQARAAHVSFAAGRTARPVLEEAVRTARHDARPARSGAATAAGSQVSQDGYGQHMGLHQHASNVLSPPHHTSRGMFGTAKAPAAAGGKSTGGQSNNPYAAAHNAAALAALAGETGQRGRGEGADAPGQLIEVVGDGSASEGHSKGTTVVTDLDVFNDPRITHITTVRAPPDANDAAASISVALMAADLRGGGALAPHTLRAALGAAYTRAPHLRAGTLPRGGPGGSTTSMLGGTLDGKTSGTAGTLATAGGGEGMGGAPATSISTTLTPHELRMLAALVTRAHERPGAPVDVSLFVPHGVEILASEQSRLLDAVYGPQGTQQLLAKLHEQVYPSSYGAIFPPPAGSTLSSSNSQASLAACRAGPGTFSAAAVASLATSSLGNAAVPFDEAPQLLGLLAQKLGMDLPVLARVALLQEAAAAAERCAGSGHEVVAWSSTMAHMLHVWHAQLTPPLSAHYE